VTAAVSEILPSANQGNLTFTIKIPLPNPKGLFQDGMFGRAKITTETRRGVLVIPREAAVTQAGRTEVFVVRQDRARAVPVTLGLAEDDRVEVTGGLGVGDEVVVQGQASLTGDERVSVKAGGNR
jgi:membrane fusion protein (multidrug efflux system)